MTEIIAKEIIELYHLKYKSFFMVCDIIKDFYSEENVDVQNILSEEELMSSPKLCSFMNADALENYQPVDRTLSDEEVLAELDIRYSISLANILHDSNKMTARILIHLPKVRVTNEYGNYIDITHLFIKLAVDLNGCLIGTFSLNRSEYTKLQFCKNYMHSHIMVIPKNNPTEFQEPCLGRGPIKKTAASLNINYDEDIWKLFCLELNNYVESESVAGTPWKELQSIKRSTLKLNFNFDNINNYTINNVRGLTEILKSFINVIAPKLKYNYKNGSYSIGMDTKEYTAFISKEFIHWYNEQYKNFECTITLREFLKYEAIIPVITYGGNFYVLDSKDRMEMEDYKQNSQRYIGKKVCDFKGKEYTLNITDEKEDEAGIETIYLLDRDIVSFIITQILKIINYRYGRSKNPSGKRARYL